MDMRIVDDAKGDLRLLCYIGIDWAAAKADAARLMWEWSRAAKLA
jgi:hypothetical protein